MLHDEPLQPVVDPDDPEEEPDEDPEEEFLASPLHVVLQSIQPEASALSSSKLSLHEDNMGNVFIPMINGRPLDIAFRKKALLEIISDLSLGPINYLFIEKILHVSCSIRAQLYRLIGVFATFTNPCS